MPRRILINSLRDVIKVELPENYLVGGTVFAAPKRGNTALTMECKRRHVEEGKHLIAQNQS